MKLPLIKKLTLPSIIIWLVPFFVGFLFYDKSGKLVQNYWVFKASMMIAATVAAYFMLRTFFKDNPKADFFSVAVIIFLFQVILDLIVLVALLKMPFMIYLFTVVPVYVVLIPLTTYVMSRMQRKK